LEPLQEADARALRERLDHLLCRLPPRLEQIIELRLQGRSTEEVAAELGVPKRTVRRALVTVRLLVQQGQTP
jgi:RNA polymerase sigma factor (sigma-70 family)